MRLAVPALVVLCVIGGIAGCSSDRDGSPVIAGTVQTPVTAGDPSGDPTSPDASTPVGSGSDTSPGEAAGAAAGGNGSSGNGQAGNSGAGGGSNGEGSAGTSGGESSPADTRKADCALTASELKPVHDTLSGFASKPPTDPDVATSNLNAAASSVGSTRGKVSDPGLKKHLGNLQAGLSNLSTQISDAASSITGVTKLGEIVRSAESVKGQASAVTAYCRA